MDRTELKKIRLELGFTQVDLAQRLDVSRTTYLRWESGECRIPGMTNLALEALRHRLKSEMN